MGSDVTPVHEPDELDPSECWHLLRTVEVGRLAVAIRNRPDIFPVNFVVDNESIVINTAPGTKLAASVLGRAVAFEADVLDSIERRAWSVVLKGTAEEVTTLEDLMNVQALGIETWTDTDKTRYLRVRPESITGRRI